MSEAQRAKDVDQFWGVAEGSGGLLDWFEAMDPEEACATIHDALNDDLELDFGDTHRPFRVMCDEFDNLQSAPSAAFREAAVSLMWAVVKRMNEYREASV